MPAGNDNKRDKEGDTGWFVSGGIYMLEHEFSSLPYLPFMPLKDRDPNKKKVDFLP